MQSHRNIVHPPAPRVIYVAIAAGTQVLQL